MLATRNRTGGTKTALNIDALVGQPRVKGLQMKWFSESLADG
jgi:hypothetical protein